MIPKGGRIPVEFTLQGSTSSPIVNACFVIENWWGSDDVSLVVDGQAVNAGPDFRRGIEQNVDGTYSLVVWLRKEATSPVNIRIAKSFDFDALASFCEHWLQGCGVGGWCKGWDANQDGRVNFEDFAVFAFRWLNRP
ncbi:MAG: hypothetical protein ACYTEQ_21755 [Planctomycetota bacterium]|jgi:hypothetical protein